MAKICANCGKRISFTEKSYKLNYSNSVFCEECSKDISLMLLPIQITEHILDLEKLESDFREKLNNSSLKRESKEVIEKEFRHISASKKKIHVSGEWRRFRWDFEDGLQKVTDAAKESGTLKKEPVVEVFGETKVATYIIEKYFFRTGASTAFVVTAVGYDDMIAIQAVGAGGGCNLVNDDWGTAGELEEKFWYNLEVNAKEFYDSEIRDYYQGCTVSSSEKGERSTPKQRIGVFGGTFDPVHSAHVALGEAAIKEANLRKLIVVPARVQPFKQGKKVAEDYHRETMVKLAFMDNDNVEVSDYEMKSDGLSYTIKTLKNIKETYPEDEIFFISGTDSFLDMDTWYRGEEILSKFSLAVAVRPGYKEYELNAKIEEYNKKYGTHVIKIRTQMMPISATDIRERLAAGEAISDLVPPQVERYIEGNGLYK